VSRSKCTEFALMGTVGLTAINRRKSAFIKMVINYTGSDMTFQWD